MAPLPGDNLIFPAGAARLKNFNDYPSGTVFGSITVSGSGYHFQGNAYQSSTFEVQPNTNVEVNAIYTDTLTIGAGATVTIAAIPGGPHAANSALKPLAADALLPNQPETVAQPTAADTIAPSSSTATTTIAAEPIAASTVLATPVRHIARRHSTGIVGQFIKCYPRCGCHAHGNCRRNSFACAFSGIHPGETNRHGYQSPPTTIAYFFPVRFDGVALDHRKLVGKSSG